MLKTIIFDFDGTIADSINVLVETINETIPGITREFLAREESVYLLEPKFVYLIKEFRFKEFQLLWKSKEIRRRFVQKVPSLKPFNLIRESLLQLKKTESKLIIVTSNSKEAVELFLENNNLQLFDEIIGNVSVFGKETVLRNLLFENKENCYYIGDEVRDVVAARQAGCHSVAVTWGLSSKQDLVQNNPEFVLDDVEELVNVES